MSQRAHRLTMIGAQFARFAGVETVAEAVAIAGLSAALAKRQGRL
jgi:hypothetical protein